MSQTATPAPDLIRGLLKDAGCEVPARGPGRGALDTLGMLRGLQGTP